VFQLLGTGEGMFVVPCTADFLVADICKYLVSLDA